MRALNLHLKILIALLIVLGCAITAYQIFILKTPLTEHETDKLWTVDARISFEVPGSRAVKAQFYIPPKSSRYLLSNELFIAKGYGQNIDDSQPENRFIEFSARKVSGLQVLYYRFNLSKRYADAMPAAAKGITWREAIPLHGAKQLAADTLINVIRQRSSNTATFITATINLVNNQQNSHVNLLLGRDRSLENRINVIETLLSQAHIPIERAHTIKLANSKNQVPGLWIRSYITHSVVTDKEDDNGEWYYFNPLTGNVGLPDDQIVWWIGNNHVLSVDNGMHKRVTFSLEKSELTALDLAKLVNEGNALTNFSFYSLPITAQFAYQIMMMIPFGVLVILILRNIVGITTLGTFTPVLIALAFRETGLVFGIIFFSTIVAIGLLLRSYLEHLKLQMLPRLSIVLTFVVLLIVFMGLLSHKLGFEHGLSISLFPMVILTMTIERLSITWEERGASFALKVALGTLITASIAYAVMGYAPLGYLVFTFPGLLLLLIAFMLAMGRYRGYRLLELLRFKALVD